MSFDKYYFGNRTYSASYQVPFLRGVNFALPRETKPKPWTPSAQVTASYDQTSRLGAYQIFRESLSR